MSTRPEWWQQISPDIHQQMVKGREESGNTQLAVNFIEKLLTNSSAKILDIACGSGRHSLEFARRGYQVSSLDYTRGLLDIAQQRGQDIDTPPNWIHGTMLTLPFPDNTFDASVSMWQSMGYFKSDEENEKAFSEMARVTKYDGICVTELLNPIHDILMHTNGNSTVKDGKLIVSSTEEEEKGMLVSTQSYFDEENFRTYSKTTKSKNGETLDQMDIDMRLFTLPEMGKILQRNGLKIKGVYSSFDYEPFILTSKHMIIVAQKKFIRKTSR